MKKILAIPHIGTALGHFYRTATFLNDHIDAQRVFIAIPESFINYCRGFLRPGIEIIPRKVHCSVSNRTGIIDREQYKALLKENERIYNELQPDLIVGDPGVQAAMLASKYYREWIGIMHGCYLPFPASLSIDHPHMELLRLVWSVLNSQIDKLVEIGTGGAFGNWSRLRNTGTILIPNTRENEPSEIGRYIDLNGTVSPSWDGHNEVEFLITCCSAGSTEPSREFLSSLVAKMHCTINVAGIHLRKYVNGVNFLGKNIHYRYLVGEASTVLTHGGHGTLQAISSAKRVIMIPGDFDQLYNSIIAHATRGWELVFDKDWLEVINSGRLFKREVIWNNLTVYNESGGLFIKGLDILDDQNQFRKALAS